MMEQDPTIWNQIIRILNEPIVSVIASVLSIFSAILAFWQYKNTKAIRDNLEKKQQSYNKAQFRGRIDSLIRQINDNSSNPRKLLVGGKINKEITQLLSEIRSNPIYNDGSISSEIKKCEQKLRIVTESSISNLKDCLCDLSRAIDKSIKELK